MNKVLFAVIWVVFFAFLTTSGQKPYCGCKVNYRSKGCWNDNSGDRTLPDLIANLRGGIVWTDWDNHLPKMVCECAEIAEGLGYDYFSIQFWGECWAGFDPDYKRHGKGAGCYTFGYNKCNDTMTNCVGATSQNTVYTIKHANS